ncbi:SDR family oxidoreductase [Actinophytocola sp.]|uniref:SDR family oxidoreductase n=1 Tax=Actinophytocola sp. TaxID=1872138 RepID=UPI00389A1B3B
MTTVDSYFAPDLLTGRTAVVTGGGSGIGLAIATAMARVGADVVITSRSADRLAAAERDLAERTGRLCASLPCDVREEVDVARLHDFVRDRYGHVSIVVNSAAANFRMPAERMTGRAMRAVFDTDLMGTFTVTREFLPDMIDGGGGAVLSLSIPGADRGFAGFSHAGAAKTAIVSLSCSWASEWGKYGIRVNSIAPGPVPTQGVASNMLGHDSDTSAFTDKVDMVPMGRLGTPDDIALAAVFLCSDAAGWITGVNMNVDGGLNMNPGP